MRIQLSCFVTAVLAAACGGGSGTAPGSNSSPTPTPTVQATGPSAAAQATPTPIDPPIEEVQFFGVGDVQLQRKGFEAFSPLLSGLFRTGDRLKIGINSSAQILCLNPKRLCQLNPGEYQDCCGPTCTVVAQMMRTGVGENAPIISKAELSNEQTQALTAAEQNIRNLQLGAATTQFLITRLYAGWKLQETTVELDRLTVELEKPEARTELKQNYRAIKDSVAEIQTNFNRPDRAKDMLNSNLKSEPGDALEDATTHVRLADAYNRSGDQKEAEKNLEKAKDIYATHGEAKAAEKLNENIRTIRAERGLDRKSESTAPAKRRQP